MTDQAAVDAALAWVKQVRAWTQYTTFAANQVESVEMLCLALDKIDTLAAAVRSYQTHEVGYEQEVVMLRRELGERNAALALARAVLDDAFQIHQPPAPRAWISVPADAWAAWEESKR
jgi:hypothetical protein